MPPEFSSPHGGLFGSAESSAHLHHGDITSGPGSYVKSCSISEGVAEIPIPKIVAPHMSFVDILRACRSTVFAICLGGKENV